MTIRENGITVSTCNLCDAPVQILIDVDDDEDQAIMELVEFVEIRKDVLAWVCPHCGTRNKDYEEKNTDS